jgi:D-beta-D-heptose 7-phosphate kinase/D-beta-D-heptose 1-phosphate adenosyltransferase
MKKIFVNGAFDVLHTSHLDLLNFAKSLGDYLLVAIDTDYRVKCNKGQERPFNNFATRKAIMLNLKAVDEVQSFETDQQLIDIIRNYSPDIMVKGSDWRGKRIIGEQYCRDIVFFERINDESTTKTIEDFIARRQLL